jgi:hypothetical protein
MRRVAPAVVPAKLPSGTENPSLNQIVHGRSTEEVSDAIELKSDSPLLVLPPEFHVVGSKP